MKLQNLKRHNSTRHRSRNVAVPFCKTMETKNVGISQRFSEGFGKLGYPNFLYFRDIPNVIKDGFRTLGVWDIPNVTKDGLPESAGKGLLCVITVLQITTPPYGLIIDLSI